jgi:hypothetical protein
MGTKSDQNPLVWPALASPPMLTGDAIYSRKSVSANVGARCLLARVSASVLAGANAMDTARSGVTSLKPSSGDQH